MKIVRTIILLVLLTVAEMGVVEAFPIPLPSPVPANETPFANLQPGQYAVLTNLTTTPANDDKACSIRLSQKFDKSGQAAVIYVIKEDTVAPAGQWDWIDKYNIILVNLGLWDNQPFYTTGYDEAGIMITNAIIPMLQGTRYLVEKYYHPDTNKFYVSGWSVGGDLLTAMSTYPAWRRVIKGVIGTPGATILSGDPTTVPLGERGWVKYFNGCGSTDGAEYYCETTETMRQAGVKANNTVIFGQGHSTGEPIREPAYLWFRGRGLNLEYYDGTNFNTLLSGTNNTRQEATLNFSWTATNTYEYAPALARLTNFSMRFSGLVQPRFTETYTFYATADDGVRVWVNNTLIINQWVNQAGAVTSTGTVALVAGQPTPIKVEYFRGTGPGTLKLEWSSVTQAREQLPQIRTYYGSASSLPAGTTNNGAWTSTNNIGAWFDSQAWTGGVMAFGAGQIASFTNNIATNQIVSLDGDVIIGGINISDDGAIPSVRTFSTSEDGLLNLQPVAGNYASISVREAQAVMNVPLYGSQGLLKTGAGSLQLNGDSVYPGTTRVEGGTLRVAGRFTSPRVELANSGQFELSAASTLNFYATNTAKTVLTGLGTFRKTGSGTVQLSNNGQGCALSLQLGSLLDVAAGKLLNGTFANSDWSQNYSSLALAAGTIFDVWNGGAIRVDGLNGAGSITNGLNGGTTTLTVGVAGGSGTFSGPLRAIGLTVIKSGSGVQTLSGAAASLAGIIVTNGTLNLTGAGSNYLGAVTASGSGQLRLGWQLTANTTNTPAVSFAASSVSANTNARLDVVLNSSGSGVALNDVFWLQPRTWNVLTASSISGAVALGTVTADLAGRSPADYGTFTVQSTATSVLLVWTPLPLNFWRWQMFGTNATNSAIAGNLTDPDHDGVPNLFEYATGMNPQSNDVNRLPVGSVSNGYLTLTYTRLKQATDVTAQAEAAAGLATGWTTAGVTNIGQVDAGSNWIITARDAVPVSNAPARFMRLRITQP